MTHMLAPLSAAAESHHAAVHGARGHSCQHARGAVRVNYALQSPLTGSEVQRHQPQLNQPRRLQECCAEQQQTLWLSLEHHALLQLQIEPAQRLQEQLFYVQQQQEQQLAHSRQCSILASSGSAVVCAVGAGSFSGLQGASMVTALAAVDVTRAIQHQATAAANSTTNGDNSSDDAGIRQRVRRRLASPAVQSVSTAAGATTTGADADSFVNQRPHTTATSTNAIGNSSSSSSSSRSNSSDIRSRLQQQLASRTAINGSSSSADGVSNDSNIAAVLQQLQQKLGQRFSPKAPTQRTSSLSSAGKVKQLSKQPQQALDQQASVMLDPQTSPIRHKSASSRQRRRTSPSRLLRSIPLSSSKMLENCQEFVHFSGKKLKCMYPDQQHTASSLLQLQESTATPLVDLQKVLDTVGAPEAVRLRLLWDWRSSARMPADLKVLQQQLIPFSQMATLLGGVDSATEILSTDSTYMVLQVHQLQERLLNLQQLLLTGRVLEAGPGASHAAAAAAASVSSGSSSLAAIRQRLTSRHQHPTKAAVISAASLSTGNSSSSSSSRDASDSIHVATSSSSRSVLPVNEEALTLVRCSPGILWLSPRELQKKMAAVQQALALQSTQEVLQIMRLQPLLLSVTEARLQAKVAALATSLQLPLAHARSLLLKQPLLLNLSVKTLTQRVPDLAEVLGLPQQVFVQLVVAKPGMLFFSPEKMRAKSIRLQRIAATHNHWAAELKGRLSPGSLVQLLTVGDKRLMRAEYLVTIKKQHEQSMLYTIQAQSEQAFKQKFRGFEEWYRQQSQQDAEER